MSGFEAVNNWLRNDFNIQVSEEWLIACLEWIHHENGERNMSASQLQSQVFDQWLNSDLTEIGQPVLPPDVCQVNKMELVSNYPLQMTSCIDAGFALYGQKQKLQGNVNANEQVTAEDTFKPAWEPRPSQMIVLELTDGQTQVRALEVDRIPGLHTFLPSGTKILITGTVLSRRGMLMLTSGHVKVLGGEIDVLAEVNSPLTNIDTAMAKNREYIGATARQEFSGKFLVRGDKKKIEQTNTVSQWNQRGASSSSFSQLQKNGPSKYDGKVENCGPSYQSFQKTLSMTNNSAASKQEKQMDVEWEDDDLNYAELFQDEMEVLDEVDAIKASASTPTASMPLVKTSVPKYPLEHSRSASKRNPLSTNHSSTSQTVGQDHNFKGLPLPCAEEDMFDDDLDLDLEALASVEMSATNSERNFLGNDGSNVYSNAEYINKFPTNKNSSNKPSYNRHDVKRETSQAQPSPNISPVIPFISDIGSKQHRPEIKNEDNSFRSFHSKPNSSKPASATKQSKLSDMFKQKSSTSLNASTTSSFNQINSCIKTEAAQDSSSQSSKLSADSSPLTPVPSFLKNHSSQAKFTPKAVVQPFRSEINDYSEPDVPFNYLCELIDFPGGSTIVVKAYISTLTSKLESNNGAKWSLSVRINDGTASMEVSIHNNVLTEFIGFSSKDSMEMRRRIQKDRDEEVKQILFDGLDGLKFKLSSTSCLMQIEIPEGVDPSMKPVLRKFIPVTSQHVALLRNATVRL